MGLAHEMGHIKLSKIYVNTSSFTAKYLIINSLVSNEDSKKNAEKLFIFDYCNFKTLPMKNFFTACLFLLALTMAAQTVPRYQEDVQTIKKYDQMYQIPAHPILFVGSSSIRKWDGLQVAFGSYNVINRGIGGAVTNDIVFYLNDIVFPYEPRQIVIYVGENDLPDASTTADTILNRTKKLYRLIRAKMPTVPIAYISMKPSPSRDQYQQKAKDANALVRNFLSKEKNTVFIDIFSPMMKDGKSRPELFVEDRLHMNAKGYAIWEAAVRPYLLK
jgi:lysophospholipase L1-like esterase